MALLWVPPQLIHQYRDLMLLQVTARLPTATASEIMDTTFAFRATLRHLLASKCTEAMC